MANVTLDTTVRISENTVFRELSGEAVLLDLDAGVYFGLDPVGTRLWQLIAEHGTLRTVATAATQEFDVAADVLERDLVALVSQLQAKRLVTVD